MKNGKYLEKTDEDLAIQLLSNFKNDFLYYHWLRSDVDKEEFFKFLEDVCLLVFYKLFKLYISQCQTLPSNFDQWRISKSQVLQQLGLCIGILDEDFSQFILQSEIEDFCAEESVHEKSWLNFNQFVSLMVRIAKKKNWEALGNQ